MRIKSTVSINRNDIWITKNTYQAPQLYKLCSSEHLKSLSSLEFLRNSVA